MSRHWHNIESNGARPDERARRDWHRARRQRVDRARRTRHGTHGNGDLIHPAIVGAALLTFAGVLWGPELIKGAPPLTLKSPAYSEAAPGQRIAFGQCDGPVRVNCVVDGDTFWMAGEKIRILDIDTPETHPPRCAGEARLGTAATLRLHALLNAGPVAIARDGQDRYGRTLARVSVGGSNVGSTLIAEGLARPYGRGRRSWC